VLQVVVLAAGTHALLAGGGAGVGTLLQAEEAVLELVHACVGEQQGRVVRRDQRAGSDTGVPFFFEEAQEGFTDFCAFHRGIHGIRRPRQKPAKGRIISGLSLAASTLLIADSYGLSASCSMRAKSGKSLDHLLGLLGT